MSQTVSDKVTNHFVTNLYLLPYLERKLIDQNVATRIGKGSEYANKLIIDYLNAIRIHDKFQEIYCLKVDISKYFYSISHELLINKLKIDISDSNVINILISMIGETNQPYVNEFINYCNLNFLTNIPFYDYATGLSIGAMTSQFLAIYFLNDLDHYIKEKLKCKYYVRYMDDFIIFDVNKERLKVVWREIEEKLTELRLKMNPKSGLYRLSAGFSFLGYSYRVVNNKLRMSYRKSTYKKIQKRLKLLEEKDMVKYYRAYASYYGYLKKIKKCERKFKMKTIEKYDYYKKNYPNHIIFVKEGTFYKTFRDDAIIVWHFFDYKWNGDAISFGASPYSKVLDKLNQLEISYVVVSNNDEKQVVNNDAENFDLYLRLATKRFEKYKEKKELSDLFNLVLSKMPESYDDVKLFLTKLVERTE